METLEKCSVPGGLVEDEDGGIFEEGAGDGDALLLAARDGDAALADHRGVAAREAADEVVGVGQSRRLHHLRRTRCTETQLKPSNT